jgi:hypothetical protein
MNHTAKRKRPRRLPFSKAHIVAVLAKIDTRGMAREELLGALTRRVAVTDYHRQRYAEWVLDEFLSRRAHDQAL